MRTAELSSPGWDLAGPLSEWQLPQSAIGGLPASSPCATLLHQFAWQTTLQAGWATDYYQRKRDEGKSLRWPSEPLPTSG